MLHNRRVMRQVAPPPDIEPTADPTLRYCDRYYTNQTLYSFWDLYEGIPETLIISLATYIFFVVAFSLVRKWAWNYGRIAMMNRTENRHLIRKRFNRSHMFSMFYFNDTASDPNMSEEDAVDMALAREDTGLFSWIPALFKISDEQMRDRCGNDAVQYQRFQRHLIAIIAITSVPCLFVILPLNITMGNYEGTLYNFGRTTISNLHPNSNILWVHCLLALGLFILTILIMRHFVQGLAVEDDEEMSDTVIVSNVPTEKADENLLSQHFREAYTDTRVNEIQFATDISELTAVDRARVSAEDGRVNSEAIQQQTGVQPLIMPYICGSTCCCHCCTSFGFHEVDAIEFYSNEEQSLKQRADQLRAESAQKRLGIAFVTFTDAIMATRIVDDFRRTWCGVHNPTTSSVSSELAVNNWKVKYSPAVDDIIWENLAVSRTSYAIRVVVINIMLTAIFLLLTTPTVILHMLDRIEAFRVPNNFIMTLIPSLLLTIASSLLPLIVYMCDQTFVPHWTEARRHSAVMRKVFIYLLFMVLILPSLGMTSINAIFMYVVSSGISDIHFHWSCIFVARNSAFYCTYVISCAFIGCGIELTRIAELLTLMLKIWLARSVPERTSVRKLIAVPFVYGCHYGWQLCLFACIMAYSVICPVIMIFGLMYIVIKHYTDRYNLYFAYIPSKISRKIHLKAIYYTIIGVSALQFILMAFIVVRADKMKAINIFALIVLAFVLVVLFGKSLCGILLPHNYRKKFGYQLLSGEPKESDGSVLSEPSARYIAPVLARDSNPLTNSVRAGSVHTMAPVSKPPAGNTNYGAV